MIEELNFVYMDENANTWSKKKFSKEDAKIFSHYLVNNNCYMCEDCTYCENCIGCKKCTACDNCHNCNNCDRCKDLEYVGFAINEKGIH